MTLNEIKEILENNPVALSTVTEENKPNVIAVAFVKIVQNQILITDNYMNETLQNIKANNNVCLVVWNKDWQGYKIVGAASYYNNGEWLDYVKKMSENKGLPAKGAILTDIEKIVKLG
ncbi:MAG: pyridoxamine 5'-phosphate oxidase-related FMN-binding protein [Berkelbacteria bacterium GW2011_GWE1_39_12]|uniref:Pyridoxamine 5'-phosphate oxidase-related FMN-binding protein n=1 Tax=Berkelbacteria bacterium GW2011_GWE1_39_12 TaxID=1618337 RepID=A0A0G4B4Q0_9BACT|nr:MAG: pyridoxamine 5'-phosphate oxidase-related FMN-binding protein [Berkelbacteria bacterium GW2011_GWE1_39_12]